jgi:hypothetical protein
MASRLFQQPCSLEVQLAKFRLVSQNPGESVHAYNVRWNLERDLVDELAVADMYPAGSVHAEELESLYIRSLAGSLSSRLLAIGGTLSQIVPGGARTMDSDGGLSVGLQLLQKHAVKLDNDQIIASELRKLISFSLSPQPRKFQRITHLGADSRFLNLRMRMRRTRNVARIFSSSFKQKARLTGRLLK